MHSIRPNIRYNHFEFRPRFFQVESSRPNPDIIFKVLR